ncbi:hypothetical protein B0J12DRAFT_236675 [Macrophomina phaseolina]|uniref:Secreted protein n=1 Tax=Macrophomina phaseolina TaxID=35725 RepID=A0ABQ8GQD1_9PEZI|nr:hypothetical protein B0J12DRAFT_236675 [Macrophomina phaseolina]
MSLRTHFAPPFQSFPFFFSLSLSLSFAPPRPALAPTETPRAVLACGSRSPCPGTIGPQDRRPPGPQWPTTEREPYSQQHTRPISLGPVAQSRLSICFCPVGFPSAFWLAWSDQRDRASSKSCLSSRFKSVHPLGICTSCTIRTRGSDRTGKCVRITSGG